MWMLKSEQGIYGEPQKLASCSVRERACEASQTPVIHYRVFTKTAIFKINKILAFTLWQHLEIDKRNNVFVMWHWRTVLWWLILLHYNKHQLTRSVCFYMMGRVSCGPQITFDWIGFVHTPTGARWLIEDILTFCRRRKRGTLIHNYEERHFLTLICHVENKYCRDTR